MKKVSFLCVFLLVVGLAVGAQASITEVYSYAKFLNYCPNPVVVENFEDTALISGLSISEVGGAGSIHDGVYENVVDNDIGEIRHQTFNYSPGMFGFAGWFDLSPGGSGTSIDMYIADTNTKVMNIPNTAAGGFYGFFSDTSFSAVRLEDGNGVGLQETYYLVDLAVCPVPVPGSLLLLGSGLIGLVGLGSKIY